MKKLVLILVLMSGFLLPNLSKAQTSTYLLNATYHEQTRTTCDAILVDDGGSNAKYDTNTSYWMALCPATPNSRISLSFEQFDVHPSDRMEIFSGVGLNGSIHTTADNTPFFTNNDLLGEVVTAYVSETSGCLTVHFISDSVNTASGFRAKVECVAFCQYPVAALDTFFNKISPDGTRTPFQIRSFTDTIWAADSLEYTLSGYKTIDICENDSIEIIAKPIFPDSAYGYPQDITTCIFSWNYGDMTYDTIEFDNHAYHRWDEVRGFDLGLTILDTLHGGCRSRNAIDVRVRIAKNPIKTVSPIPDMCSGQVFAFNVGYEGNNTIKIDSILFERGATQRFDSAVFIPDGPNCSQPCYESPVTFTEFVPGAVINSVDDILSICVNMEHSFLGDLSLEIVCPNGNSAILKHFTMSGGAFMGQALDQSSGCDPTNPANAMGICWTYCFSNQYLNIPRGVISGNMTSPIDSTRTSDTTKYFQTPVQGATSIATGWETTDLNGFSNLIGCPLNGEWKIRVCDYWGIDNGWVCWWDMSLSQGSMADWEYQVPLDTVMLDGPFIIGNTDTSLFLAPPIDSCGSYNYDVHIVDDFLCVWDTVTKLEVVCTPQVDLGDDIQICEELNTTLDAGNPGASEYSWEPYGEKTQTIEVHAPANANDILTYIAEVTNTNGRINCYGQDTLYIEVLPAGLAAFHTDPLILEGCEPFNFQLISNSTNADTIEWTVGQLKSSLPDPSFTFPYGIYDVKLKVVTQYGCVDSIVQPNMIHVYKSPTADFGWQPTNPSSTAPFVNFLNQTTPYDVTNQYLWKIQALKNSDLRENIYGLEPTYTWQPAPGLNVVGDYKVTLDAYTVNIGPSGVLYECHDTITKVISIINDSLMFPSLVSPNGDGINDVFIIRNLVDGQAFPDNELTIYNRNGKRIHYVQDIRSEVEAWDPNKTNTPSGTYFYRFVGRGPTKNVEFNGTIEVMR